MRKPSFSDLEHESELTSDIKLEVSKIKTDEEIKSQYKLRRKEANAKKEAPYSLSEKKDTAKKIAVDGMSGYGASAALTKLIVSTGSNFSYTGQVSLAVILAFSGALSGWYSSTQNIRKIREEFTREEIKNLKHEEYAEIQINTLKVVEQKSDQLLTNLQETVKNQEKLFTQKQDDEKEKTKLTIKVEDLRNAQLRFFEERDEARKKARVTESKAAQLDLEELSPNCKCG